MFRSFHRRLAVAICVLGMALPATAEGEAKGEDDARAPLLLAQAYDERGASRGYDRIDRYEDSPWSAHAGVGFTLSPGAALFTSGVEYEIAPGLGIGPLLQVGVDDDILIVAPTANLRYRFDLSRADNEVLRRFEPFVQGGLGLAYVEKQRRGPDRYDTEFLMNGGFGFEYRIDDQISVGNSVLFNGMPADDAAGEDFFFSWQFLTARIRF